MSIRFMITLRANRQLLNDFPKVIIIPLSIDTYQLFFLFFAISFFIVSTLSEVDNLSSGVFMQ